MRVVDAGSVAPGELKALAQALGAVPRVSAKHAGLIQLAQAAALACGGTAASRWDLLARQEKQLLALASEGFISPFSRYPIAPLHVEVFSPLACGGVFVSPYSGGLLLLAAGFSPPLGLWTCFRPLRVEMFSPLACGDVFAPCLCRSYRPLSPLPLFTLAFIPPHPLVANKA